MSSRYDVAIVGAGPAGATCAALCAAAGRKTLLLEKSTFPREKVCGDCVNPGCWEIFDRLEVSERILALPHATLEEVEFVGIDRAPLRFALPSRGRREIAVKRGLLDQVLLERAIGAGAEVRQQTPVTALCAGWKIQTPNDAFDADFLVAADGRNSTVARLLGLLPRAKRDRVAVQAHVESRTIPARRVTLELNRWGYCGIAPVDSSSLNICLVSRPSDIEALKASAGQRFHLPPQQAWRSITPLSRDAVVPCQDRLLLVGDAARVVEPFTGEGILYALATGEAAADCILNDELPAYAGRHSSIYRGRMWINVAARFCTLHPRFGSRMLDLARVTPGVLRWLTHQVVSRPNPAPI